MFRFFKKGVKLCKVKCTSCGNEFKTYLPKKAICKCNHNDSILVVIKVYDQMKRSRVSVKERNNAKIRRVKEKQVKKIYN